MSTNTEELIAELRTRRERTLPEANAERDRAAEALEAKDARAERAEQERDAAHAVIAAVRAMLPGPRTFAESLARDHAGNLWPRTIDADEVSRILALVDTSVLAARDRRVAAEAWDEGFKAGTDPVQYGDPRFYHWDDFDSTFYLNAGADPKHRNPHRIEENEENR